ncbi:divalent metal cation transporter, partial [Candidatus Woesearchaeota archaeon]
MEKSLSEVHDSVDTTGRLPWFRRLFSFLGPAYLVSVGYMDPGNWATDLAGGSEFGYKLLWVLLLSNILALVFQSLSARLGVVAKRDLAQQSREAYPKFAVWILYVLAEIAIIATDLAEVLGMAIGLNLLFGLPMLWGVTLTVLDSILLLFLMRLGIRKVEAFILGLVGIIGGAFVVELFLARPEPSAVLSGFIPSLPDARALYIAIGMIGATVMPHNLYLHSALVQTRKVGKSLKDVARAIKFNLVDSALALNMAFFVNAAILILAAAAFHQNGLFSISEISDAYKLLQPLLGSTLAPVLFAVALIAAGQSSTITGTLAGQIVMEGYLNLRIAPWLRRLITRLLAILPAWFAIYFFGSGTTGPLLVLSQVVLSLQLGFAVIPLILFVSDRAIMQSFTISRILRFVSWAGALLIVALNLKLVVDELSAWRASLSAAWIVDFVLFPLVFALLAFLVFLAVFPSLSRRKAKEIPVPHALLSDSRFSPEPDFFRVGNGPSKFARIMVGLDFSDADMIALRAALEQGGKKARYLLFHVNESPASSVYGVDTENLESEVDARNIEYYASLL